MGEATFFREPLEQSKVKAEIVSQYFDVWSQIILAARRKAGKSNAIAYIDLFAGPGKYEDGTPSTPLLVLKKAISTPHIAAGLRCVFRDRNRRHVARLRKAIAELPGIAKLAHPVEVGVGETGPALVEALERANLTPSLVFLDPCGYKGLSLDLVNSLIKDWACECVFFFNYNRINAAIDNDAVAPHMDDIFGQERAKLLRLILRGKSPREREETVLRELTAALVEVHGKYVLPFRFAKADSNRTSHYLILVTKNFTGYDRMKEIMARFSSTAPQGVPSFEFNPPAKWYLELDRPLDLLADALPRHFAGRTITMDGVYKEHSPGTPYVRRNYKDALAKLDDEGRITAEPHRKGSFGDRVLVTFPPRGRD